LFDPASAHNRHGYESLVQLTSQAFAGDPQSARAQLFNEFHALTVAVGKAHCRRTPACDRCPLAYDIEHTKDVER